MATYAAYRHIELDNIGYGKKRVLKPPGGGSSDIFGAGDIAEPQRRTKTHHLSSSLSFGGEETPTPARNRAGKDSFYNLFGTEPQFRPASAIKDKLTGCVVSDRLTTNDDRVVKKSINFEDSQVLENTVSDSNGTCDRRHEPCETNGVAVTNGTVTDDCQDSLSRETTATGTTTNLTTTSEVSPVSSEVPSVNGTATTNSAASTPAPTPTAQAPAPAAGRPRVPPGGFSSGLW